MLHKWMPWEKYITYQNFPTYFGLSYPWNVLPKFHKYPSNLLTLYRVVVEFSPQSAICDREWENVP